MGSRQLLLVGLTALFFVTSAGAASATVQDASPVDGQQATDQPLAQQTSASCDYTDLYNDTIDGVVSVEAQAGFGSGFVYETNESTSYVVTNDHVVGEASEVTVQFERGEQRDGDVVGGDAYSDLAVVRVEDTPEGTDALNVSAENPNHGERVAAIGSPFGFEATMTHGIVSGVNRSMPTQRGFAIPNTIQTDAPISLGNSGGPLVGCDGEVLGVNTAGIAAPGAENLGFAVAGSVVERVVPDLVESGEFAHPYLGISGTPVTPAIAEANDLNESEGVMVVSVQEDGPANDSLRNATSLERADGEVIPIGGDVIVAAEGQPIATTEDLRSVLLHETRPGESVNLTVVRDGERTNLTVSVGERPPPVAETR